MTLHEIIKKRLKEREKLLEDLFVYMKISRPGYGKAIKGNIKLNQIEKIAEFLEIPVPELLLPLYYEETEKDLIQSSINFVRKRVSN
jgi:transcriptional regulator with XRE-family HTH domain